VHLSDAGGLYWTEDHDAQVLRHDIEPGTTWWRRALVWGLSLLPIEPLL
jgi:putative cardiolipin synthase